MAFLGNDGSIVLDATITDVGRQRMAKGNFVIKKFALGDDEISYESYNKSHASGSSYFDLEILQTPILEAFTNNTSTMKSHLLSIPRTNLLYLPVIKINENFSNSTKMHTVGAYVVAVDKDTEDLFLTVQGVIPGETSTGGTFIRCDQGLDTTDISANFTIDADLTETQYILEIDNRFGKLLSVNGTAAKVSYIDDDNVASYYFSLGTDLEFVSENSERTSAANQTIDGPRGTIFQFQIQSSLDLNSNDSYFNNIGSTTSMTDKNSTSQTVKYIDSFVRLFGGTTGYHVDIPVRYIKV